MKENNLLIISILILALSIFAGSLWIGYSMKSSNESNKQNYLRVRLWIRFCEKNNLQKEF